MICRMTFVVVLAAAPVTQRWLPAQERTDFSGTWVLTAPPTGSSKECMGVAGLGAGARIVQHMDTISIATGMVWNSLRSRLDGAESRDTILATKSEISGIAHPLDTVKVSAMRIVQARWSGRSLRISWVSQYASPSILILSLEKSGKLLVQSEGWNNVLRPNGARTGMLTQHDCEVRALYRRG